MENIVCDDFIILLSTSEINILRPYFKEHSYLASKSTNIRSSTIIRLRFKPDHGDGLLFYVCHNMASATGDFLAISLMDR